MQNVKFHRAPLLAAAATAIAVLPLPRIGAAAAVSMNPVADAFVSSANATNNYGAAGALDVAAAALPKGEFQSLMRFDLSAARTSFDGQFGVGQWQVQSATLQLTATTPNNPVFNTVAAGQFSASWMQNDSWLEGTGSPNLPTSDGVTFSTLPSFLSASDEALGMFAFAGGTSGNNTYTLGLPGSFTADMTSGNNVSLRLFAADNAVSYVFDSRNFGTAGARPLLTVNAIAIPEPTSVGLVVIAALAIGGIRKIR